jgi:aminocarboxymuconate-semialdehyde decarboxylase
MAARLIWGLGAEIMAKKPLCIDIHTHIRVPAVLDWTAKNPNKRKGAGTEDWFAATSVANMKGRDAEKTQWRKLTDAKTRLRGMDAMGVDIQVISSNLPTTCYWADGATGAKVAQLCNNGIAEFVAKSDRFIGLGSLPLQDMRRTVKEFGRMVNDLDMRGAWIPSMVRAKELGTDRMRPLWAKAQELNVPIFVHPLGFSEPERLREFYLWNTVGQPLEEALAMSSLIYEGIMDDFPRLKIGICHGGGYLPYYSGRADNVAAPKPEGRNKSDKRPSDYMHRFYYDSIIFNRDMLQVLVRKVGVGKVMMATDYPHGERDPIGFIKGTRGISAADKARILGGNAARLFRIAA